MTKSISFQALFMLSLPVAEVNATEKTQKLSTVNLLMDFFFLLANWTKKVTKDSTDWIILDNWFANY